MATEWLSSADTAAVATDSCSGAWTKHSSMPDGTQVPAEAIMVGQADKLHVFAGREWFRMNIDEMTSQSL